MEPTAKSFSAERLRGSAAAHLNRYAAELLVGAPSFGRSVSIAAFTDRSLPAYSPLDILGSKPILVKHAPTKFASLTISS